MFLYTYGNTCKCCTFGIKKKKSKKFSLILNFSKRPCASRHRNKKEKLSTSHRLGNTFQRRGESVEFELYECLYVATYTDSVKEFLSL